jgi:type II secretory pathway pseudopilin PulG
MKKQIKDHDFHDFHDEQGMTLIEIIMVVSLLVGIYAAVAPDLFVSREMEIRTRVNRVAEDVKSAFDMSVLSGKTHRLVFDFESSNYWLESVNRASFTLGGEKSFEDLTAEQEKELVESFEEKFSAYEALAGESVVDPSDDSTINPTSPVLKAKSKLKPPVWKKITSGEWAIRALGPELRLKSLQAEHHRDLQSVENGQPNLRGMIYFFPSGYVEKAVVYIEEDIAENTDNPKPPFTIYTNSYEGSAVVEYGFKEINVTED